MTTRKSRGQLLTAGTITGLAGAVASVPFPLTVSLLRHEDLLVQLKLPAFPFLGDRVHARGFDAWALFLGGLAHFGVSLTWGFGLALIVRAADRRAGTPLPPAPLLALGAAWGVVVWLVMFYAVLPLAGAAALAQTFSIPRAITEHVLFGVGAALGLLAHRRARA